MQKLTPISESQVSPLKAGRTTFIATIPSDTDIEAVLQPTFWANVANQIRVRNHIEADWEDGSKLVSLRVVGVGTDFVKVKVMNEYKFDVVADVIANNDFKVEWKAQVHKFSVIRKSTNEYVKDGFTSKEEANEWLKDNLSKIAA